MLGLGRNVVGRYAYPATPDEAPLVISHINTLRYLSLFQMSEPPVDEDFILLGSVL